MADELESEEERVRWKINWQWMGYVLMAVLFALLYRCFRALFAFLLNLYRRILAWANPKYGRRLALLHWIEERTEHKLNGFWELWENPEILGSVVNGVIPVAYIEDPHFESTRHSILRQIQALVSRYFDVRPMFLSEELKRPWDKRVENKFIRLLHVIKASIEKLEKQTRQEDAGEYVARGMGLIAATRGHPAAFFVYSRHELDFDSMLISFSGPGADATQITIAGTRDNAQTHDNPLRISYEVIENAGSLQDGVKKCLKVTYTPNHTGDYKLDITKHGYVILGSPFNITVENNKRSFVQSNTTPKPETRVINRVVDFVNEKMLLTDKGKLVKITADPSGELAKLKMKMNEQSAVAISLAKILQKEARPTPKVFFTICEYIMQTCHFILKNSSCSKGLRLVSGAHKLISGDTSLLDDEIMMKVAHTEREMERLLQARTEVEQKGNELQGLPQATTGMKHKVLESKKSHQVETEVTNEDCESQKRLSVTKEAAHERSELQRLFQARTEAAHKERGSQKLPQARTERLHEECAFQNFPQTRTKRMHNERKSHIHPQAKIGLTQEECELHTLPQASVEVARDDCKSPKLIWANKKMVPKEFELQELLQARVEKAYKEHESKKLLPARTNVAQKECGSQMLPQVTMEVAYEKCDMQTKMEKTHEEHESKKLSQAITEAVHENRKTQMHIQAITEVAHHGCEMKKSFPVRVEKKAEVHSEQEEKRLPHERVIRPPEPPDASCKDPDVIFLDKLLSEGSEVSYNRSKRRQQFGRMSSKTQCSNECLEDDVFTDSRGPLLTDNYLQPNTIINRSQLTTPDIVYVNQLEAQENVNCRKIYVSPKSVRGSLNGSLSAENSVIGVKEFLRHDKHIKNKVNLDLESIFFESVAESLATNESGLFSETEQYNGSETFSTQSTILLDKIQHDDQVCRSEDQAESELDEARISEGSWCESSDTWTKSDVNKKIEVKTVKTAKINLKKQEHIQNENRTSQPENIVANEKAFERSESIEENESLRSNEEISVTKFRGIESVEITRSNISVRKIICDFEKMLQTQNEQVETILKTILDQPSEKHLASSKNFGIVEGTKLTANENHLQVEKSALSTEGHAEYSQLIGNQTDSVEKAQPMEKQRNAVEKSFRYVSGFSQEQKENNEDIATTDVHTKFSKKVLLQSMRESKAGKNNFDEAENQHTEDCVFAEKKGNSCKRDIFLNGKTQKSESREESEGEASFHTELVSAVVAPFANIQRYNEKIAEGGVHKEIIEIGMTLVEALMKHPIQRDVLKSIIKRISVEEKLSTEKVHKLLSSFDENSIETSPDAVKIVSETITDAKTESKGKIAYLTDAKESMEKNEMTSKIDADKSKHQVENSGFAAFQTLEEIISDLRLEEDLNLSSTEEVPQIAKQHLREDQDVVKSNIYVRHINKVSEMYEGNIDTEYNCIVLEDTSSLNQDNESLQHENTPTYHENMFQMNTKTFAEKSQEQGTNVISVGKPKSENILKQIEETEFMKTVSRKNLIKGSHEQSVDKRSYVDLICKNVFYESFEKDDMTANSCFDLEGNAHMNPESNLMLDEKTETSHGDLTPTHASKETYEQDQDIVSASELRSQIDYTQLEREESKNTDLPSKSNKLKAGGENNFAAFEDEKQKPQSIDSFSNVNIDDEIALTSAKIPNLTSGEQISRCQIFSSRKSASNESCDANLIMTYDKLSVLNTVDETLNYNEKVQEDEFQRNETLNAVSSVRAGVATEQDLSLLLKLDEINNVASVFTPVNFETSNEKNSAQDLTNVLSLNFVSKSTDTAAVDQVISLQNKEKDFDVLNSNILEPLILKYDLSLAELLPAENQTKAEFRESGVKDAQTKYTSENIFESKSNESSEIMRASKFLVPHFPKEVSVLNDISNQISRIKDGHQCRESHILSTKSEFNECIDLVLQKSDGKLDQNNRDKVIHEILNVEKTVLDLKYSIITTELGEIINSTELPANDESNKISQSISGTEESIQESIEIIKMSDKTSNLSESGNEESIEIPPSLTEVSADGECNDGIFTASIVLGDRDINEMPRTASKVSTDEESNKIPSIASNVSDDEEPNEIPAIVTENSAGGECNDVILAASIVLDDRESTVLLPTASKVSTNEEFYEISYIPSNDSVGEGSKEISPIFTDFSAGGKFNNVSCTSPIVLNDGEFNEGPFTASEVSTDEDFKEILSIASGVSADEEPNEILPIVTKILASGERNDVLFTASIVLDDRESNKVPLADSKVSTNEESNEILYIASDFSIDIKPNKIVSVVTEVSAYRERYDGIFTTSKVLGDKESNEVLPTVSIVSTDEESDEILSIVSNVSADEGSNQIAPIVTAVSTCEEYKDVIFPTAIDLKDRESNVISPTASKVSIDEESNKVLHIASKVSAYEESNEIPTFASKASADEESNEVLPNTPNILANTVLEECKTLMDISDSKQTDDDSEHNIEEKLDKVHTIAEVPTDNVLEYFVAGLCTLRTKNSAESEKANEIECAKVKTAFDASTKYILKEPDINSSVLNLEVANSPEKMLKNEYNDILTIPEVPTVRVKEKSNMAPNIPDLVETNESQEFTNESLRNVHLNTDTHDFTIQDKYNVHLTEVDLSKTLETSCYKEFLPALDVDSDKIKNDISSVDTTMRTVDRVEKSQISSQNIAQSSELKPLCSNFSPNDEILSRNEKIKCKLCSDQPSLNIKHSTEKEDNCNFGTKITAAVKNIVLDTPTEKINQSSCNIELKRIGGNLINPEEFHIKNELEKSKEPMIDVPKLLYETDTETLVVTIENQNESKSPLSISVEKIKYRCREGIMPSNSLELPAESMMSAILIDERDIYEEPTFMADGTRKFIPDSIISETDERNVNLPHETSALNSTVSSVNATNKSINNNKISTQLHAGDQVENKESAKELDEDTFERHIFLAGPEIRVATGTTAQTLDDIKPAGESEAVGTTQEINDLIVKAYTTENKKEECAEPFLNVSIDNVMKSEDKQTLVAAHSTADENVAIIIGVFKSPDRNLDVPPKLTKEAIGVALGNEPIKRDTLSEDKTALLPLRSIDETPADVANCRSNVKISFGFSEAVSAANTVFISRDESTESSVSPPSERGAICLALVNQAEDTNFKNDDKTNNLSSSIYAGILESCAEIPSTAPVTVLKIGAELNEPSMSLLEETLVPNSAVVVTAKDTNFKCDKEFVASSISFLVNTLTPSTIKETMKEDNVLENDKPSSSINNSSDNSIDQIRKKCTLTEVSSSLDLIVPLDVTVVETTVPEEGDNEKTIITFDTTKNMQALIDRFQSNFPEDTEKQSKNSSERTAVPVSSSMSSLLEPNDLGAQMDETRKEQKDSMEPSHHLIRPRLKRKININPDVSKLDDSTIARPDNHNQENNEEFEIRKCLEKSIKNKYNEERGAWSTRSNDPNLVENEPMIRKEINKSIEIELNLEKNNSVLTEEDAFASKNNSTNIKRRMESTEREKVGLQNELCDIVYTSDPSQNDTNFLKEPIDSIQTEKSGIEKETSLKRVEPPSMEEKTTFTTDELILEEGLPELEKCETNGREEILKDNNCLKSVDEKIPPEVDEVSSMKDETVSWRKTGKSQDNETKWTDNKERIEEFETKALEETLALKDLEYPTGGTEQSLQSSAYPTRDDYKDVTSMRSFSVTNPSNSWFSEAGGEGFVDYQSDSLLNNTWLDMKADNLLIWSPSSKAATESCSDSIKVSKELDFESIISAPTLDAALKKLEQKINSAQQSGSAAEGSDLNILKNNLETLKAKSVIKSSDLTLSLDENVQEFDAFESTETLFDWKTISAMGPAEREIWGFPAVSEREYNLSNLGSCNKESRPSSPCMDTIREALEEQEEELPKVRFTPRMYFTDEVPIITLTPEISVEEVFKETLGTDENNLLPLEDSRLREDLKILSVLEFMNPNLENSPICYAENYENFVGNSITESSFEDQITEADVHDEKLLRSEMVDDLGMVPEIELNSSELFKTIGFSGIPSPKKINLAINMTKRSLVGEKGSEKTQRNQFFSTAYKETCEQSEQLSYDDVKSPLSSFQEAPIVDMNSEVIEKDQHSSVENKNSFRQYAPDRAESLNRAKLHDETEICDNADSPFLLFKASKLKSEIDTMEKSSTKKVKNIINSDKMELDDDKDSSEHQFGVEINKIVKASEETLICEGVHFDRENSHDQLDFKEVKQTIDTFENLRNYEKPKTLFEEKIHRFRSRDIEDRIRQFNEVNMVKSRIKASIVPEKEDKEEEKGPKLFSRIDQSCPFECGKKDLQNTVGKTNIVKEEKDKINENIAAQDRDTRSNNLVAFWKNYWDKVVEENKLKTSSPAKSSRSRNSAKKARMTITLPITKNGLSGLEEEESNEKHSANYALSEESIEHIRQLNIIDRIQLFEDIVTTMALERCRSPTKIGDRCKAATPDILTHEKKSLEAKTANFPETGVKDIEDGDGKMSSHSKEESEFQEIKSCSVSTLNFPTHEQVIEGAIENISECLNKSQNGTDEIDRGKDERSWEDFEFLKNKRFQNKFFKLKEYFELLEKQSPVRQSEMIKSDTSCSTCQLETQLQFQCRRRRRKRRSSRRQLEKGVIQSAPTSDSETPAQHSYQLWGSERLKVSERIHIKELFEDVFNETGWFRGAVPNKKAVLASLRSIDHSADVSHITEEDEDDGMNRDIFADFEALRNISNVPRGYQTVYPYIPTTPIHQYRSRPCVEHNLIPRNILLRILDKN